MTGPDRAVPPWVVDETVGGVLRRTAARFPARDAVVFPALGVRWSWAELDERVDRVASGLIGLGIERGEHVGLWSMNAPEWVVTQFAVGRIGSVLGDINPAYRPGELEDALRAADVTTLVVGRPFKGSNYLAMIETLCPGASPSERLPRLARLIALDADPGPGWLAWSDLEQPPPAPELTECELAAREAAAQASEVYNIQFTSGTTGLPKGAMLTHRNVLLNAYYVGERLRYDERDRVAVPVPFYHCFGCVLGTLVCAVFGSAIVVPSAGFDPAATLAAVASERCTALYGVPTMFVAELAQPDRARLDLSSLRTGIMAGSPCPLPLMEQVVNELGARELLIGYGQTEASPIITMTRADDPLEVRVGTVGRPLPGLEVRVVDPASRRDVVEGEAGELCVRGHCVMAGYYNNPDATARLDPDGWLHTGDLARRRPDGNYRIVGRLKELIIRGENIYPPEVEEFLHHHPAVAEVAVVGLPDPKFGEVAAAWIVPRSEAELTEQDLRAYCRDRIAHYKVPAYFRIVAQLPRTVTGKVRKHVLRDEGIRFFGLEVAAEVPTA